MVLKTVIGAMIIYHFNLEWWWWIILGIAFAFEFANYMYEGRYRQVFNGTIYDIFNKLDNIYSTLSSTLYDIKDNTNSVKEHDPYTF